LNVAADVTFLGSISEETYLEEMRKADVFVLASNAEPMGVVYMEAMAVEVPTVGTAAGGVGEIITDGIDGLLVPPQNPPALADALRRLIGDVGLRQRLGQAGRKRVVEHFDSRLWADVLWRRIEQAHAPREETRGVRAVATETART
jgi:glycosyltransferase involved in cell wall biosynthesis